MERGARDPVPVAVEGASGAAAFDGNHTNDMVSWLFANENWHPDRVQDQLAQLMEYTIYGHLAWVVFPPQGYRFDDLTLVL